MLTIDCVDVYDDCLIAVDVLNVNTFWNNILESLTGEDKGTTRKSVFFKEAKCKQENITGRTNKISFIHNTYVIVTGVKSGLNYHVLADGSLQHVVKAPFVCVVKLTLNKAHVSFSVCSSTSCVEIVTSGCPPKTYPFSRFEERNFKESR